LNPQGETAQSAVVNQKLKRWEIPDTDLTRAHAVTARMLLNPTAGMVHAHYELDDSFSTGESCRRSYKFSKAKNPRGVAPSK
jgi:hypothetical protein